MSQEHNRRISKHNAFVIIMIGYLGLGILITLIFLSIFMKGNSQIVSILSMVFLFILLFIFRNPKKVKFFNLEIVNRD